MYNNQSEKNLFLTLARRNLAEKKNKHFFLIEGKFAMLRLWAMNQCSEAKDASNFYDSAFTSEGIDGFLTDLLETMYIGCDDGVHERITGSLISGNEHMQSLS